MRNKGAGNKVNVPLHSEKKILLVLFAEIIVVHDLVRERHTLSVGDLAACDYLCDDCVLFNLHNLKNQKTVVNKNLFAHGKLLGKILICDGNLCFVTLNIICSECELISVFKDCLFIFKRLYSVLGTLCVKHYCNGKIKLFAHLFNKLNVLIVFFIGAVGKVEPCNAHSGKTHFGNGLFIAAGRSDSAYYFGLSHIIHLSEKPPYIFGCSDFVPVLSDRPYINDTIFLP